MVPFAMPFGQMLARKASLAVGGNRRKGRHLHSHRKHIAVGAKPVSLSTTGLDTIGVSVVENLHFDSIRKPRLARLGQTLDGLWCDPDEDS